MKNLKRFLSLALSGVMLVGMMAMGASAAEAKDFTDIDEIQNKQAVTTMASLNVINGKDTGAFDPEGIVTRAEMAKMITVMMNGGKDPVLPTKGTPTYTDIGGHWAEKYIEYCSSQGIIAGRGDGTFAPDETVTASQAAKMALVALGYDSAVFNFTGIDWEVNVNSYASAPDADLYEDFAASYNPSEGMKRDDAALLLYNTLDAKVMSKSYDSIVSNGEVTQKYSLSDAHFIEDRFNAVKVEGIVVANEDANLNASDEKGSSLDDNRTRVAITNYNGDKDSASNDEQTTFSGNITVQATTGLDELGRKVTVYVKKNSTRNKAEILGDVIVSTDNVVVTDYSADCINDVADDNGLNFDDGMPIIAYDYRAAANATSAELGNDSVRGLEKILIDYDDDGSIEYVLINAYRFGKVTSYSASGDGSIQVNANKIFVADKSADVVGFDDVAKNDYVLVNYIGGKVWVEKAESVTGEISAYKEGDAYTWEADGTRSAAEATDLTTKMTVDETEYNVSAVVGYENGADSIQRVHSTKYGRTSLGTTATFYMDKGGYIVAAGDVADTAYNYALVLAKDTGINEQVKVALSDGTKATYVLNTGVSGSNDKKFDEVHVGSVYAYNLTSTGKIKLSDPKTTTAITNVKFTSGKTTISTDEGRFLANTNTAFFYVGGTFPSADTDKINNSDVNIYTGYNKAVTLDAEAGATGNVYTNNAGNVVAVLFKGEDITKADVNNYLYINSVGMTNSDYTAVKAFVDGSEERQDIKIDGTDVDNRIVALYTINSNGYYELDDPDEDNLSSGFVTKVGTKSFVLKKADNTEIELKVTADTLLVDDSKYLDTAVARLGDRPEEDDKITYVLFDLDSAGEPDTAKLIVVRNEKQSAAAPTPTPAPAGTFTGTNKATLKSDGTFDLEFHGTQPTGKALVDLIKAADPSLQSVTVDNSGNVSVTDKSGSTYAVTVNPVEYIEIKIDNVSKGFFKKSTKIELTGLAANAKYIDASKTVDSAADTNVAPDGDGKVTIAAGLTADKNLVTAFKILAQTDTNVTTFATDDEAADPITAGTTFIAKGTKVTVTTSAVDKKITAKEGFAMTTKTAPTDAVKGVYSFTVNAEVAADTFTEAALGA